MRMRLVPCLFAAVLLLAGCATPTPYQPRGLTGGFSETRISDDIYQVKFTGNGLTSGDKVWYYWLYRCAELTKSKGYSAFLLLSDKAPAPKTSDAGSDPSGMKSVHLQSDGQFIQTKSAGGYTYYYVPSYGGGSITTYSASAFVRFVKDPIPDTISYFRAQTILDTLKPYIASEGNTKVPARVDLLKQAYVIGKNDNAVESLLNSNRNTNLDDYKNLLPAAK